MITDVSSYILYELALLRDQHVRFCRYKYYDSDFNEGYVLVSDYNSFFMRIETHEVEEKHDVHFLIIKAFENLEIEEAFSFHPVFEGTLKDVSLLKSSTRGMVIRNQIVQDITTESALLAEFDGDRRLLIFPREQLFTNTCYSSNTDEILDVMLDNRYEVSRVAEKNINLLLCEL